MKTSCATSSRRVMPLIQRRTAGEAFSTGEAFPVDCFAWAVRDPRATEDLTAGLAGVAPSATESRNPTARNRRNQVTTFPVCQIYPPAARAMPDNLFCDFCDPGGFRGAGRFISRFTHRT